MQLSWLGNVIMPLTVHCCLTQLVPVIADVVSSVMSLQGSKILTCTSLSQIILWCPSLLGGWTLTGRQKSVFHHGWSCCCSSSCGGIALLCSPCTIASARPSPLPPPPGCHSAKLAYRSRCGSAPGDAGCESTWMPCSGGCNTCNREAGLQSLMYTPALLPNLTAQHASDVSSDCQEPEILLASNWCILQHVEMQWAYINELWTTSSEPSSTKCP
jgi:hypothetical protein